MENPEDHLKLPWSLAWVNSEKKEKMKAVTGQGLPAEAPVNISQGKHKMYTRKGYMRESYTWTLVKNIVTESIKGW